MKRLFITTKIFQRMKFSTSSIKIDRKIKTFEFNTINDIFNLSSQINKNSKVFGKLNINSNNVGDSFQWITYSDMENLVDNFKKVLTDHNISKNDKVAIISNNRLEWAVANFATLSLGAVFVPMYESQLQKDWEYVINDSDSKLLIVANEKIYEKTKHYIGTIGILESMLCLDSSEDYLYSYQRWMNLVNKKPSITKKIVDENEIATIIYTSGTTGNPKGVELSHKNFVSNIKDVQLLWDGKLNKHTTLNILPWAHVFGLTMELYSMYATGSSVAIVSDREKIFSSFKIIKPTFLLSVPLFFNKIRDGILKNVSNQSTFKKYLFNYSLKLSRERNNQLEFGSKVNILLSIKYLIADKIVFSKIRDALGGELEYMASGGAATSLEVLQFFEDIGIPICEGYGLTETSPCISASQIIWSKRRLGTCGVPMTNLDVRILDPTTSEEQAHDTDGEICVSGPSVMIGYRNNQAANDEVFFMKDGKRFFKTGDVGRLVEGKFLKITGRIKEQYKLENGKYIIPSILEDTILRSIYISQCIIYGDNKEYNIVLIVPDFTELKCWAEKNRNWNYIDDETLLNTCFVTDLISSEIETACQLMRGFEKPRKFYTLIEPFSQDNQMLTPKLSLRRKTILQEYSNIINNLYENDNFGVSINNSSFV